MSNENVGTSFSLEKLLRAQSRTIELVRKCADQVKPGMTEEDTHLLLKQELDVFGSEKLWHPSKIRFAENTLKTFREKSIPDIVIKDGDPFFFDIGPVFDGHEGDYGETFICGQSKNASALTCEVVFKHTAQAWREDKLTGVALYEVAQKKANELGFELNLDMDGHRLGDFPHALHYKGGLGEQTNNPNANLWILEIHLRHQTKPYGCFFEDILK